ncbi:ABC transporter ATP-binding protein [Streptomyces agglomeratus]|uniref:ABC transporter ATP-binding protein n=1 Tax=Streptomyces agglomeratus TaxID=285458 RepID=A0A1E5PD26_9ACTN|nr:ABC transporter ATP-binding protein [Streptomyces agglomeratus]OEJ27433.1 ABC transporter ATP-binding protein [Streptomyces agglomeratus]OEJ38511.1 ABC transporter ATP-binding protein [Streptomyces agglomeratus]OEJ47105.1 ABC transporter ATP-binding protein [Streptomyces agglomeratus]OEJ51039.1 ABC transporter ATP-binding protein [Streptomyces agglomeratus]OEJ58409.1 ABC transporter ATP-binding protein [Streptomyces agglomeratus]
MSDEAHAVPASRPAPAPVSPPVPAAPAAVLRAEGLVKSHHGEGAPAHAVRGVDLTIRPGEFVAVTGPSGAGKSTLLHLLGGLQRPDSGSIWLDGVRVDGHSEARWAVLRRRRIGVVFQFFNLVSNLTVADNIELPALLAGSSARQARTERANLLAELGLEGKERSMPGELSGGEQQRVALARALVNHPGLLLADEPTGSLDSKGTREVMRLLSRFHQRGQAILLVTHDHRLASTADRVVSFFDGRIADDAALGAGTGGRGVSSVLELKD